MKTPLQVLVVDDSIEVAECFARALEAAGHRASFVVNPQDALDAAEGIRPEVVFVDIDMPNLDGWQLSRLFRQRFGAGLRLVALTGLDPEPRRGGAFDDYLVKPVSLQRLLDVTAAASDTMAA